MFYQNFSVFQLHRKKDKFGTWRLKPTSVLPWNRWICLVTQLCFLGLFKTKKLLFFFPPKAQYFFSSNGNGITAALTWPFYNKALYKPVILWWQHCPGKSERQSDIDAHVEWLGHKHGTYRDSLFEGTTTAEWPVVLLYAQRKNTSSWNLQNY